MDEDEHLMGQTAGLIAMMSALVKTLPPSTRKRLLRQIHVEFDSLLATMSTTGGAEARNEREGVEWMRDLFLKRIVEADSKQKGRKASRSTAMDKGAPAIEPPPSAAVDFEL